MAMDFKGLVVRIHRDTAACRDNGPNGEYPFDSCVGHVVEE